MSAESTTGPTGPTTEYDIEAPIGRFWTRASPPAAEHSAATGWPSSARTSTRRSRRRAAGRAVRSGAARNAGTSRCTRRPSAASSTWSTTRGSGASAKRCWGRTTRSWSSGFDAPFPGAKQQPWHRDFPSPRETREERRLTSLAFNITTVDTTDEMGPFEIAPGTQWDPGEDFDHGMFPPRSRYPEFESLAVRKYPKVGDISARSALTVHRGTPNRSSVSRARRRARCRRPGRRQPRAPRPGRHA